MEQSITKSHLKKLTYIFFISLGLFVLISTTYSSDRYFLCGPDEDQCYDRIYQYCSCIPYNDVEANNPYCLDFDKMTCTPLSQSPGCYPMFIYKTQGECLATIFQSSPIPSCTITTRAFCLEHHSSICDPNGHPNSCH